MATDPQSAKPTGRKRKTNRQLIMRALTEPDFRKLLVSSPEQALGKELAAENRAEIRFVLAAVKAIEAQIAALADELLCANGGPCGIA